MKNSFLFLQPRSLDEAVDALSRYGGEAKLIAGGTAVVLMMQNRLIAPQSLISLGKLPELAGWREDPGGLHLGAMVRLRDIERSGRIQSSYPALAFAAAEVGNVRVRNQATLGGNLAEADYASDPPAVLLALDASVTMTGPRGRRTIPLSDFILGFYTTALEPDEVITEVHLPQPPAGARMAYLKYRSRSSEDRPCAGVAVLAVFEGQLCSELRIAVGAACETPRRLAQVEGMALGERLTDELVGEIAEGYAQGIDTLDDLRGSAWYRREMVRVHVRQALEEVRDGRR